MKHSEYKAILESELYKGETGLMKRIYIKYIQPNTNCMYLARKMWYYYERGGYYRKLATFIHIKIHKKYGCYITPSAQIEEGFYIYHPVGIVIGECKIGLNFHVLQNTTIGVKSNGNEKPTIGDNCILCANSLILGNVEVCDNVKIGACSLVNKSIYTSGVYTGIPAVKINI